MDVDISAFARALHFKSMALFAHTTCNLTLGMKVTRLLQ